MTDKQIQEQADKEFQLINPDFGITYSIHGHLNYGKKQYADGATWARDEMQKEVELSAEMQSLHQLEREREIEEALARGIEQGRQQYMQELQDTLRQFGKLHFNTPPAIP